MVRFAFTAEIEIEAEDKKAAQTVFDAFMAKGIDSGFVERYSADWPQELRPHTAKVLLDMVERVAAEEDPDACEGGVCSAPDGAPENVFICVKHSSEVYGPKPRPRPATEDSVVDLSDDDDQNDWAMYQP